MPASRKIWGTVGRCENGLSKGGLSWQPALPVQETSCIEIEKDTEITLQPKPTGTTGYQLPTDANFRGKG